MTPELIAAGLQLAMQVVAAYPKVREAATTEERARLDALFRDFLAGSEDATRILAATPDDQVG